MLLLLSQHVVSFEEQRPPLANLNYVRWSDEDRADAGSSRVAHVARGIMEEADVRSFVTALQEFRPDPKKLDSTDGLPAYEFYIRHEAKDLHSAAEVLRLGLEQRVAAFTAERYNCTTCYLCNVLLRRYQASERMAVPSHYDRLAYITAVASLNPTDFDGGLYLQRSPRAESREYFRTGSRDMIFHQYDLNHGVDVIDAHATPPSSGSPTQSTRARPTSRRGTALRLRLARPMRRMPSVSCTSSGSTATHATSARPSGGRRPPRSRATRWRRIG